MAFNVAGARKEGYSDKEIADFLATQHKFNVDGARSEGYNDTEIADYLSAYEPPKPSASFKPLGESNRTGSADLSQPTAEEVARASNFGTPQASAAVKQFNQPQQTPVEQGFTQVAIPQEETGPRASDVIQGLESPVTAQDNGVPQDMRAKGPQINADEQGIPILGADLTPEATQAGLAEARKHVPVTVQPGMEKAWLKQNNPGALARVYEVENATMQGEIARGSARFNERIAEQDARNQAAVDAEKANPRLANLKSGLYSAAGGLYGALSALASSQSPYGADSPTAQKLLELSNENKAWGEAIASEASKKNFSDADSKLDWMVDQFLLNAPSTATTLVSIFNPKLAPYALGTMATYSGGGQYTELVNAGVDNRTATLAALAHGSIEAAIERAIPVELGQEVLKRFRAMPPLAKAEIGKRIVQGVVAGGTAAGAMTATEGGEELVTGILQRTVEQAVKQDAMDKGQTEVAAKLGRDGVFDDDAMLNDFMGGVAGGAPVAGAVGGYGGYLAARPAEEDVADKPETRIQTVKREVEARKEVLRQGLGLSKPAGEVDQDQLLQEIGGEPEQAAATQHDEQPNAIDEAAHAAATSPQNDLPEPTDAQKEAGNYRKGHVTLHGLDISIENPRGSTRSGVDQDGKAWETTLAHHYGYVKRTEGADGDQVDVFIGDKPESDKVFVVDQIDPKTGKFDEHKALLGFDSQEEALAAYHANYQKGWKGANAVHAMTADQFKGWLENGDTKRPIGQDGINPDMDEDAPTWAGRYDVIEKGGAPKGYRLLGKNADGNEVYEAGTSRAVVSGDYVVRELAHKPSGERVAEFRTAAELGQKPSRVQQIKAEVTAKKGLSIGTTPNNAEPITVKNGVVHIGKYPAAHFETGEDITVPAGADNAAIAQALRDAGAVGNRNKIFGVEQSRGQVGTKKSKKSAFATSDANEYSEASRKMFLAVIRAAGGIKAAEAKDITGEPVHVANRQSPGLFRNNGTNLDLIAGRLHELGYLSDEDYNDVDGGVQAVRDLVRQALNREFVGTTEQAERLAELEAQAATDNAQLQEEESQALADNLSEELSGDDIDLPDLDAPGNMSEAEAMRALGFTEREIDEATNGQGNQDAQAGTGAPADGPAGAGAQAGTQGGDEQAPGQAVQGQDQGFELARQTEAELGAKDAEAKKTAEAKAKAEAAAEAKAKADRERDNFTLTGSDRAADANPNQGDIFSQPAEKPEVSSNTVFTEDAAAAARALLKKKLGGQLNSGLDPEVMQAGITLAGYHIEKGARSFTAYAKAMIEDLGEAVKPYLKSWYVAIKLDPRAAGFAGDMDGMAEVEAADVESVSKQAQSADSIPTTEPEAAQDKESGGDNKLIALGFKHLPKDYTYSMTVQSGNNREYLFNVREFGTPRQYRVTMTVRDTTGQVTAAPSRELLAAGGIDEAAQAVQKRLDEINGEQDKPGEFKNGDRVQITASHYNKDIAGRHGEVADVRKVTWTSSVIDLTSRGLGVTKQSEETHVYYDIKTDGGFIAEGVQLEQIEAETGRVASVPDPVVDGKAMTPEALQRSIKSSRDASRNYLNKADAARKADKKAEWRRMALAEDAKTAKLMQAWAAWAKEHGNAAEAVGTETKPAAQPAATDTAGILKAAGLVVKASQTKHGTPTWEVSGNTREHSETIKRLGGRWYGPKKVWSFYKGDPSEQLAQALGVKVESSRVSAIVGEVKTATGNGATLNAGVNDDAEQPRIPEQARPQAGDGQADRGDGRDSEPSGRPLGGGVAEADARPGETGNADASSEGPGRTGSAGSGVRESASVGGRDREPTTLRDRPERAASDGLTQTPSSEGVSLSGEPRADFTIGDDTQEAIEEGGQKTKARHNIAAIKIVKKLAAEDRRATVDEQKALARYVGWGGIKQIFDEGKADWSALRDELKNLLTAEEYAAANRSILDAHFTSMDVVSGMWGAAKHLGFRGGRVLEPSVGVGNFFGAMPSDMRANSALFGVELDNITGQIAKYLYPNATIATPVGFQDIEFPSGSFDFATGNPPFGEQSLYDRAHPEFRNFSIHQFFFAKALDKVRPGGILQMVVSRYLMDARDGAGMTARAHLAQHARLLGAIRLPYNAFLSNANTEVVTDIVFLQKLEAGEEGNAADWTGVADIETVHPKTGERFTFSVNRYFADHPEMVVGTHAPTGKMRQANQYNVEPPSEPLALAIGKAVASLPRDVYRDAGKPLAELASADAVVPEGTKVFGYYLDGETIMQRLPDSVGMRQARAVEFKDGMAPKRAARMIRIRDALRSLMRAELSEDSSDSQIAALRAELNREYDGFRKTFGYINQPANRRAFAEDPDLPLLESLEPKFDPGLGTEAAKKRGEPSRKPSAEKADIFTKRVLQPLREVKSVETAKDALVVSLNERGRIDPEHMAEIYGKPWEDIRSELGDLIYLDPNGAWETADAYLSGNVKAKLKHARAAAEKDPAFSPNVAALEAVQPADMPAMKISVRLGSPWIPNTDMDRFVTELFGAKQPRVRFVPQVAKWSVQIAGGDETARYATWGTRRVPAEDVLEHVLNNKPIVVKDNHGDSKNPNWVTNEPETEAARAKAQEMAAKFREWIWQDQERRNRLERIYNDNYNTDVRRKYDGAHLTLPGSNPAIQLRPHQKAAIWRAIQDRSILLDHVVGAGKTFEMAAIAMELRRLGVSRKPMFMVPNSLVRQWRDEFYKLYPNANVLAATEADFAKANRRRFMAKIATGDWDAVVVAHSSFKKIGMPADTEKAILNEQLKEIADAIEEMKRERGDRNIMRDMERMKEKIAERLKALADKGGKKDDVVTFDELGTDALMVDEAHCFPADTKVLTNAGHVAIGEIVEKRLPVEVLSVNSSTGVLEWKPVTGWFKNAVTHYPVRVHHAGGVFECTANHKVWTDEEGYVEAGRLTERHTITLAPHQMAGTEASREDMPAMRAGIQVQIVGGDKQRQETVLLEPMRGGMEDGAAAHQGEDIARAARGAEEVGHKQDREAEPGIVGANESQEPNAQPGDAGEDAALVEWTHIPGARRERETDDAAVGGERGARVANGACDSDGARVRPVSEPAEALQGGLGAPGVDDGNRNRREDAQDKTLEISGQAKNGSAERARVVRVEVLERGSDGQFPDGFREDQSVYCLEVEDNHNFFAEGVLVSNSFKNLFYTSGMRNVAGLGNPTGSGRAFDLFVKLRYLDQRYSGKAPVVFATGTPVSNSLVEMFTMQRYMAWNTLKDRGLHLLDAWAGVYGDVQNVYEVHPSGTGYRLSTRFAKFVNLPSLMDLYRSFADVVTMDDLKDQAKAAGTVFPVPKIKGGRPQNVVADRSEEQTKFFGVPEFVRDPNGAIVLEYNAPMSDYGVAESGDQPGKWVITQNGKPLNKNDVYDDQKEAKDSLLAKLKTPKLQWNEGSILWKFENLRELNKESNGKINALSITNEARKAGLDFRLINPAAPDFSDSKINKAVENVLRIHKTWAADRGAQLIFCDLSVPQSAKAAAAVKEREAFVRREDGTLEKVKATVATVEGVERAFLVVKRGSGEAARFMVYDGATGANLEIETASRADAGKALAKSFESDLGMADRLEQFSPIDDAEIADWKDANEKESAEEDGEGDGAITVGELLGLAGGAKFSVYDDIKAKLIANGIPEKEVAFIHDYDTAAKKNDLFKRVNAGEIRILLGSTEKMGAGMNVQKRLVALHHLDAPWRPSDLEQREGRIVRQGNDLYARDPDGFEVEILRYGTRQTYDTRMWQIIEHKAAGVEQLRKAGDDLLEIDDVGGEAANAADMKAAASGNPLILEEIKLRNEVKSLEAQQFGHIQARAQMQDRISFYRRAPERMREDLDGILPFKEAAESNPAKPFRYKSPAGKVFDDIKNVTTPITEAFVLAAKGRSGDVVKAGEYRGMNIEFYRVHSEVAANVEKGGKTLWVAGYSMDDKFSPAGLFTRIDNAVAKLAERERDIRAEADRKLAEIPKLETEINKPFAKEDELKDTRQKHREVVSKLAKSGGGIEMSAQMKSELQLELVKRQLILSSNGGRGETLYSRSSAVVSDAHTPQSLRAAMDAAFGKRFVGDLFDTGKFEIVTRSGDALAYYDPQTGKTYFVANHIGRGRDLRGLMLHEVGVHALTLGRNQQAFKSILKYAELMRKTGNKDMQTAYARAQEAKTRPEDMAEEMLGYYVEANPETGFARRVIAWFKGMLLDMGLPPGWLKLTDKDIAAMAANALRGAKTGRARAIGNDGELAMNSGKANWYYSALARMVLNGKQEAMPAQQWKLWVMSNAANNGVKKDEIQWTGLYEWLDLQGKGKVSKADVLNYLNQNGVQVEDVVLGEQISISDVAAEAKAALEQDGVYDLEDGTKITKGRTGLMFHETPRGSRDIYNLEDFFRSFDGTKVAGNEGTKFASYQLPGGENYRELLLTLPQKTPEFELRTIAQMKDFLAQNKGVADSLAGLSDVDKLKKLNRMRAKEGAMQTFQSSHFEQKNILAHVRFNERTDADGKKVLFIEEIQSDFGQSFKKQRDAINRAVDADFEGIVERMKKAGVLEVNCD